MADEQDEQTTLTENKETGEETVEEPLSQENEEESSEEGKQDGDNTSKAGESSVESEEKDLQAQVSGLTKELARVRKDRNASSRQVQELRDRLSQVQGMLEGLKLGDKSGTPQNPLAQYSEDDLVQGQTEWEDTLLEARDALRQARTDGDKATEVRAQQAVGVAQRTITAIRKELLSRSRQAGAAAAAQSATQQRVVEELTNLYASARESFPELNDQDSPLWKAAKAEFDANAEVMKSLGALGELMAVSWAVIKDPSLIKGKEKRQARKELLNEIDKKVETALFKPGGKAKQKGVVDYSKMPRDEFDAMIQRVKMGG